MNDTYCVMKHNIVSVLMGEIIGRGAVTHTDMFICLNEVLTGTL